MKKYLQLFNINLFIKLTLLIFLILFFITVPYDVSFIPNLAKPLQPLLVKINSYIAVHFFNTGSTRSPHLVSDSVLLYTHVFLLIFISCIISFVLIISNTIKQNQLFYSLLLNKTASYFIGLHLLNYGFSKIFKTQFYLPEPNTLFTTIGQTPKDLLYWSTIGVSRSYNIFLGICECIAALLLLFKRTNLIGACLTFTILINVLAINLCYDISVKLFSGVLLFYTTVVISYYKNILKIVFMAYNNKHILKPKPTIKKYAIIFNTLLVGYFILCTSYPYIKNNNFNDDNATRPPLHGAYETFYFAINNEPQIPLITDTSIWRRLFFHRQGYFIAQYMTDAMQDYNLQIDTTTKKLFITNTTNSSSNSSTNSNENYFNYINQGDTILILNGTLGSDSILLKAKKLNLNTLPVLQKEFNATVD